MLFQRLYGPSQDRNFMTLNVNLDATNRFQLEIIKPAHLHLHLHLSVLAATLEAVSWFNCAPTQTR